MSAFPAFGAQSPPRDPAALARDVLAQPRFRVHLHAAPARTWWSILLDRLGESWNRLMDAFAHHVRVGPGASVAIGDALIGAMILIVLAVGARLLLGVARESGGAPGARSSALPGHADAQQLHAAAQLAAQGGAYAAAIALAFRAALAALDARGVLRDDPARTVNECRRDVRSRAPRLGAPFEVIARAFTAAVYAEDRTTFSDWSDVERAYAVFAALQSDAA